MYVFFLAYRKMAGENIIFLKNDDESYTMVDLYLNDRFLGTKILRITVILMLTKYYYLKEVIMSILLDIMI